MANDAQASRHVFSLYKPPWATALPESSPLPFDNMYHLTPIIPILVLGFLWVRNVIKKKRDNPAGLPLPPGPPRLPVVGNLLGIKDLGAQHLTYAEWSKKYGMFSVPFFSWLAV